MSDQTDLLDQIADKATELDYLIGEYLAEWTSARISHTRSGLTYLIGATRREVEDIERKAQRRAEIAVVREANTEKHEYTKFEIEMAAMRKARGYPGGHTPAEYRQMMLDAQARMGPPRSLDEQLAQAPKIGEKEVH